MITTSVLTGCSTDHLVTVTGHHRLQSPAAKAFLSMQQAAKEAGFDLQPASTFRDFKRQQTIWNEKFNGKRPVLDQQSQPINIHDLNTEQRCKAILRWSALPGTSRHHWGSDLDIYDPSLLPAGKKLQLEPWEYEAGGYFSPLNQWINDHMAKFSFYRPFAQDKGGVAVEPWHLSYAPLSAQAENLLTPALLLDAWQGKEIAGREWLTENLTMIFSRFIRTTTI